MLSANSRREPERCTSKPLICDDLNDCRRYKRNRLTIYFGSEEETLYLAIHSVGAKALC